MKESIWERPRRTLSFKRTALRRAYRNCGRRLSGACVMRRHEAHCRSQRASCAVYGGVLYGRCACHSACSRRPDPSGAFVHFPRSVFFLGGGARLFRLCAYAVGFLGFQRGIFSNEAGLGSSAVIHASPAKKRRISKAIGAFLKCFSIPALSAR